MMSADSNITNEGSFEDAPSGGIGDGPAAETEDRVVGAPSTTSNFKSNGSENNDIDVADDAAAPVDDSDGTTGNGHRSATASVDQGGSSTSDEPIEQAPSYPDPDQPPQPQEETAAVDDVVEANGPSDIDGNDTSRVAAESSTYSGTDNETLGQKTPSSPTQSSHEKETEAAAENGDGFTSASLDSPKKDPLEEAPSYLDKTLQPQEENTTADDDAAAVNGPNEIGENGTSQKSADASTSAPCDANSKTLEQTPSSPAHILEEETAAAAENEPNSEDTADPSLQQHSMEFNVALESLESMRRLNLEVEFSTTPLFPLQHDRCTYCQREALEKFKANPPNTATNDETAGVTVGKVKFDGSRLRRFRSNARSFFSKSTPPVPTDSGDDSDGKSDAATQSCPPSLASKSLSSMESIGEESTGSGNNHRASTGRRKLLKKTHHPCLTCGHPTCSKHSSSAFSKNHMPICQPCAYLFELDFLVDVIASTASDMEQCRKKADDMVDCYDRAKLLLVYTSQYAEEIASALETSTVRSNKIGAGSSATGIASGVAGVVGCGALLIPPVAAVGVPLLIASLVFGGGATAAQTGDAAVKHFSEPNKLAEKMIALHGMVLSLLRITEVLSYGLLKSQLGVNYSVEGHEEGNKEGGEEDEEERRREALATEINELLEKHGVATAAGVGGLQSALATGIVATEVAASRIVATEAIAAGAAAGAAEAGISASTVASGASVVGRNSRYIGRVGTTAASSARFIPIAGGLLSAACIYVEGKELKRTLSRMSEGNPCAKAEQVRSIKDELDMLPDSSLIAAECRHVFDLAQKEKLKKATMAESDKMEQKDGADLTMENATQGDISDIIDVMETTAKVDAME